MPVQCVEIKPMFKNTLLTLTLSAVAGSVAAAPVAKRHQATNLYGQRR
ncbi:hypothetical protein AAH211_25400 [Serratia fonticola]